MSYTVLARRYRSAGFAEVVGQEAVARTLRNAISSDRVAHAYLFTGTRGVGKTTMARILAKSLNCLESDGPTTEPCNRCDSCLAIAEGEDLDVLEIDGASNTGVEHIRELRQNVIYRPARSRFKIYIIDEVHMLSTAAFNALLKTLEEPPEHVKFIFATTEPNKVLATIQSRCQRFDFRNLSVAEIAGQLDKVLEGEGIQAGEGVTRRLARLARGSMRDALSLLDQLLSMATGEVTLELLAELTGTPDWQQITGVVKTLQEQDLAGLLARTAQAFDAGYCPETLADTLQEYLRDLMVLRTCGAQTDLVEAQGEAREAMLAQSQGFDEAALVYQITVLEELRRALKGGASGRALLEAALVRLARTERFADTRALLERLEEVQGTSRPLPAAQPNTTGPAVPRVALQTVQTPPPQPAARAESSEPAPAPLEIPAQLDLAFLQQNWQRIINMPQGSRKLDMYLQAARAIQYADGVVTLSYAGNPGMGKFLTTQPTYVQDIQDQLGATLGRQVKVQIEPGAADVTAEQNRPGCSPGSKPSQKEINQALSDPRVQQAQTILSAKVRSVERA